LFKSGFFKITRARNKGEKAAFFSLLENALELLITKTLIIEEGDLSDLNLVVVVDLVDQLDFFGAFRLGILDGLDLEGNLREIKTLLFIML